MATLDRIGCASSPDALMYDVLEGREDERLASLGELCGVRKRGSNLPPALDPSHCLTSPGPSSLSHHPLVSIHCLTIHRSHQVQMLSDPPLLVAVERRRLQLVSSAADELTVADARFRLAWALSGTGDGKSEGAALLREVISVRERALGPQDAATLLTKARLVNLLFLTHRQEELAGNVPRDVERAVPDEGRTSLLALPWCLLGAHPSDCPRLYLPVVDHTLVGGAGGDGTRGRRGTALRVGRRPRYLLRDSTAGLVAALPRYYSKHSVKMTPCAHTVDTK